MSGEKLNIFMLEDTELFHYGLIDGLPQVDNTIVTNRAEFNAALCDMRNNGTRYDLYILDDIVPGLDGNLSRYFDLHYESLVRIHQDANVVYFGTDPTIKHKEQSDRGDFLIWEKRDLYCNLLNFVKQFEEKS